MKLLTAFQSCSRLAEGSEAELVAIIRSQSPDSERILVFDNDTGQQVDLDLREAPQSGGLQAEHQQSVEAGVAARGRGRPKLGVKGREVTLLPKHWEWLEQQNGGASATLRRLVQASMKSSHAEDLKRKSQARANRVMTALAGDLVNYEDATRALFAGDAVAFKQLIRSWPADVRQYALVLSEEAFG